jgi:hypothetical protein
MHWWKLPGGRKAVSASSGSLSARRLGYDVLWATAYQAALMLEVRVVPLLPENDWIVRCIIAILSFFLPGGTSLAQLGVPRIGT